MKRTDVLRESPKIERRKSEEDEDILGRFLLESSLAGSSGFESTRFLIRVNVERLMVE